MTGINVGGVFGDINATGAVNDNVSSTVSVTGTQYVGGIIGRLDSGDITGTLSYSVGTVTASTGDEGGVIGYMTGGSVLLNNLGVASNVGFVASTDVGGAIGLLTGGTLSGIFDANASHSLTINATNNVGAVIGVINGATLDNTLTFGNATI